MPVSECPGEVPVCFQLQRPARSTESRNSALIEVINDACEQRGLCSDEYKVYLVLKAGLVDFDRIGGVYIAVGCEAACRDIARRNEKLTQKVALGKPPGNGMVFST